MDWAQAWAPYDESTYRAVLDAVGPEDVVLDIGAGDLRLARRLAARVRRVYAVEMQSAVLRRGLAQGPLPANLQVVRADARVWPFPAEVTVGVLLMRHCPRADLARYMRKLRRVGARRLLTNARWGLHVENIDLTVPPRPYATVRIGWYACTCGAVGFVPGPPQALTPAVLERVHEVTACPACAGWTTVLPSITLETSSAW